MPLYAHASAQNPVLDAVSERELAREITEGAVALWSVILSNPTTAAHVGKLVVERLAEARKVIAGVQDALAQARKRRDAASRRALQRAAGKAGARLIELDPDHEVIDDLVAGLQAIARDPEHAPRELGRAAPTRAFARHVEELSRAAGAVSDSRHRLAQANIGLVVHVAAKYPHRGLALSDLVQEGMLGLLKAIDRFDYRRGFRFSTYATWWIRHHIGRALSDKSRIVRIPVHVQESYQRLTAIGRRLGGELGRDPTQEELAGEAGITTEAIDLVREAVRSNPVSLDEPLGDDEDRTRHDLLAIPDPEGSSAFEAIHRDGMARAARRQMEEKLSRIEIDVLRKRFALDGVDREWTLQEIADTYGLSRERIRQIQDRALQRLRAGLESERIDAEAA